MSKWIPVKIRLPKTSTPMRAYRVLVYVPMMQSSMPPDDGIRTAYWMEGTYWRIDNCGGGWSPTHWMPLPKPPKGK